MQGYTRDSEQTNAIDITIKETHILNKKNHEKTNNHNINTLYWLHG